MTTTRRLAYEAAAQACPPYPPWPTGWGWVGGRASVCLVPSTSASDATVAVATVAVATVANAYTHTHVPIVPCDPDL